MSDLLTVEYPVSGEKVAAFSRDGHVLLRGLLPGDEVRKFWPAIRDAAYAHSTETRSLDERDTYGKAFLQITNLWVRSETVKRFVFAKRFAAAAAMLLGVEKVRLYHDQALFKEPGGGRTPWHQDQFYWPLDTDRTITMWMPLSDIDDACGMLTFASGSHREGGVDSVAISDESDAAFSAHIAKRGFPISKADAMSAGDATFHRGWTIHSAGENRTESATREVITIIYYADGARITQPENENQAADLAVWLDGKMPGERADGRLNPILN